MPTKIAINAESCYFWAKKLFLTQHFAGGIMIRHQQFHQLCPDNNQTKTSTLTVFEPNKLA